MFVWRGLAEAASGRKSHPGFLQLLDECRKAVARRAAFFPVSETFVIETNKYGSEVGRRETARVVAEIGKLRSLASIRAVRRLELQSALTILVGAPQVELGPYLLLGRTLLHSFQQEMVMPLWDGATQANMNQSTDVWTEATAREVSHQGGLLEFQMALLCTGNPSGALTKQSEVSLAREKHIAHLLGGENPRRTGSRLRDVLLATELGHGMSGADLEEGFENHGILLGDDSQLDRAQMTNIVRSMPSFEVSSEMRTRYQGKSTMKLKQNHVHDVQALSLTLPYCDAIYVDRAVRGDVKQARLDRRMGTRLLEAPESAAEYIAGLPGMRGDGTWRTSGPDTALTAADLAGAPGLQYYYELWEDGA